MTTTTFKTAPAPAMAAPAPAAAHLPPVVEAWQASTTCQQALADVFATMAQAKGIKAGKAAAKNQIDSLAAESGADSTDTYGRLMYITHKHGRVQAIAAAMAEAAIRRNTTVEMLPHEKKAGQFVAYLGSDPETRELASQAWEVKEVQAAAISAEAAISAGCNAAFYVGSRAKANKLIADAEACIAALNSIPQGQDPEDLEEGQTYDRTVGNGSIAHAMLAAVSWNGRLLAEAAGTVETLPPVKVKKAAAPDYQQAATGSGNDNAVFRGIYSLWFEAQARIGAMAADYEHLRLINRNLQQAAVADAEAHSMEVRRLNEVVASLTKRADAAEARLRLIKEQADKAEALAVAAAAAADTRAAVIEAEKQAATLASETVAAVGEVRKAARTHKRQKA